MSKRRKSKQRERNHLKREHSPWSFSVEKRPKVDRTPNDDDPFGVKEVFSGGLPGLGR